MTAVTFNLVEYAVRPSLRAYPAHTELDETVAKQLTRLGVLFAARPSELRTGLRPPRHRRGEVDQHGAALALDFQGIHARFKAFCVLFF